MTKLYQTKEETPRFGTLLARNSDGMAVLELRPSKDIVVLAFSEIVEVRPYTVGIRFRGTAQVCHYFAKPGSVNKGDLVAVNTQSEKATKPLKDRKLVSTPIEVADIAGAPDDLADDLADGEE